MLEQYKLLIEELGEDGEGFFSKGHHDFTEFKQAVANELDCKVDEVEEPSHEWWRLNQVNKFGQRASDYGFRGWEAQGTPGKRGSFPVTVLRCLNCR